jgi:aminoglycoside 6-adenylyltransferase
MRTEQEMLDLVVGVARADERIRAVLMNGSRANPNAPRDPFQDFDIVYLVTDDAPFRHNLEWIRRFGDLLILQMPEAMQDPPPSDDGGFGYLMQFTDGNRIDLGLYPLVRLDQCLRDSQTIVLLDKDGLIGELPPASDRDYLPKPPTAKRFADCCNEFWWVCPYVAKGLWREEITYAKAMLEQPVRDQLMKMLSWHIGVRTQFSRSPGKLGKYLQQHLEPELWELLLQTYADASVERTWDALLTMCTLFRRVAVPIAETYGFDYPHGDDVRVSAHLEHVRCLPKTATDIY